MSKDMNYVLGLGVDFPFEGKVYRVADDLEFGVAAAFERWLRREAMAAARDAAGGDPEESDALREKWFRMSAGGYFRLDGEIARQALLKNPDAATELLFLLLEDGGRKNDQQPPVDRILAKRLLKDKEAGPWAMGLCLTALGLDPFPALVAAMGLVATRAERETASKTTRDKAAIRKEIQQSLNSENSSKDALNYLLTFIDSPGEG